MCKTIFNNSKLHARLGTCFYIAPEVLDGEYDFKCDIWSCGVILYIMIFGKPPFRGKTEYEIFKKIKKNNLIFPKTNFPISEFILELL